jgi:hypothetical protein
MTEEAPKSSYELAMERLRKKDAEGGETTQTLTEAQKAAIADVRKFYDANLAQVEVLHQSKMRATFEPEVIEELERNYRRDRERINSDRDAKIEKIRRGDL